MASPMWQSIGQSDDIDEVERELNEVDPWAPEYDVLTERWMELQEQKRRTSSVKPEHRHGSLRWRH